MTCTQDFTTHVGLPAYLFAGTHVYMTGYSLQANFFGAEALLGQWRFWGLG
jgi:hypothetical protein